MATTIETAWGAQRNTPATADCWHMNTRERVWLKGQIRLFGFSAYLEKQIHERLSDGSCELWSDISYYAVNKVNELSSQLGYTVITVNK